MYSQRNNIRRESVGRCAEVSHQSARSILRPDELNRFLAALEDIKGSDLYDYIHVSLFTGARRSNVLGMRWCDIDFDLGTWTIPETKSGDSQVLPLTAFLIDLLEKRRYATDGEYVFPGGGKTGHLVELKRRWTAFIKSTGIHDIRIHDLRRTLGSYMAMGNQSLHMIGKVLGHKSQTATQIYSRFANAPLSKKPTPTFSKPVELSTQAMSCDCQGKPHCLPSAGIHILLEATKLECCQ